MILQQFAHTKNQMSFHNFKYEKMMISKGEETGVNWNWQGLMVGSNGHVGST